MADDEQIMMPRLGGHIHAWGHGHTCVSRKAHEGNCVCECGVPAPFDGLADELRQTGTWQVSREVPRG